MNEIRNLINAAKAILEATSLDDAIPEELENELQAAIENAELTGSPTFSGMIADGNNTKSGEGSEITHDDILFLMQRGAVVVLGMETQEESERHTRKQLEAIIARIISGQGEAANGDENAGQANLLRSYDRTRAVHGENYASVGDAEWDAAVLADEIDRLRICLVDEHRMRESADKALDAEVLVAAELRGRIARIAAQYEELYKAWSDKECDGDALDIKTRHLTERKR